MHEIWVINAEISLWSEKLISVSWSGKLISAFITQIPCMQYEASFLSSSQTKYYASLSTLKYFYTSFLFDTWFQICISPINETLVCVKNRKLTTVSIYGLKVCCWLFAIVSYLTSRYNTQTINMNSFSEVTCIK